MNNKKNNGIKNNSFKNGNNIINIVPKEAKFAKKTFNFYDIDNSFIIFKSINNTTYIAFSTNDSIILYNLNLQQIQNVIKNAHENYMTSFRHCLYKNKDIIMTVSPSDNNIKLWDISDWKNLTNIKNVNDHNKLYSACFLNYNNQNYILSSNIDINFEEEAERIKVFDMKGTKIKEINNSEDHTCFIDIYYDNNYSKYYIITGNLNYVKSYDYENNDLYHKYDRNSNGLHICVIIYNEENITKMIESCINDQFIRIWDFHNSNLLKIITTNSRGILGICLYNENFLFAGDYEGNILLIDIGKSQIINSIEGHESRVCSIKKLLHPLYGECLISQGWLSGPLKLWIINK